MRSAGTAFEVGVLEGVAVARVVDYRLGLPVNELGNVKASRRCLGTSSAKWAARTSEGMQLTAWELLRVGDATPTAVARAGRRARSRLSTAARRAD